MPSVRLDAIGVHANLCRYGRNSPVNAWHARGPSAAGKPGKFGGVRLGRRRAEERDIFLAALIEHGVRPSRGIGLKAIAGFPLECDQSFPCGSIGWVELDEFFQGASLRIAVVPVRGQPGPQGEDAADRLLIDWQVRQGAPARTGVEAWSRVRTSGRNRLQGSAGPRRTVPPCATTAPSPPAPRPRGGGPAPRRG
jgi:hypothetical protein